MTGKSPLLYALAALTHLAHTSVSASQHVTVMLLLDCMQCKSLSEGLETCTAVLDAVKKRACSTCSHLQDI